MSIRLNKAIKECNVGLQTAVEFLQNRGFADVEMDMNAKISDEQYELLLKEFKPDSTLRDTAKEKIQQQKVRLFFEDFLQPVACFGKFFEVVTFDFKLDGLA